MRQYQRLIGVLVFIGLLLAIVQFSGLRQHFSLAFLQQVLQAHQGLGLLLFVLLFVLGNFILLPGWLFLAAAVLTLGPLWGGLATYLAALASCLATFLFIRWLGGDALRRFEGRWAVRIFARLDAYPLQSVALLRTLFQTAPALNYALAITGIPLRQYALGTVLGLPLPIALYCLFFDYLGHALKIG